jgi:hypothetical protein
MSPRAITAVRLVHLGIGCGRALATIVTAADGFYWLGPATPEVTGDAACPSWTEPCPLRQETLNEALTPEVPATSRRIAVAERPDPPHVQFGGPGLAIGTRQPRCRGPIFQRADNPTGCMGARYIAAHRHDRAPRPAVKPSAGRGLATSTLAAVPVTVLALARLRCLQRV